MRSALFACDAMSFVILPLRRLSAFSLFFFFRLLDADDTKVRGAVRHARSFDALLPYARLCHARVAGAYRHDMMRDAAAARMKAGCVCALRA